MSGERYLIIVGGGTLGTEAVLIDHPGLTAPLDLGPPVFDLTLRPVPFIRNLDIKIEREQKRRDWEQRERKRRRK